MAGKFKSLKKKKVGNDTGESSDKTNDKKDDDMKLQIEQEYKMGWKSPGPKGKGNSQNEGQDLVSRKDSPSSMRYKGVNLNTTDKKEMKGEPDGYFGHYRTRYKRRRRNDVEAQAVVAALVRSFPWPPKSSCFFSGGYYETTPEEAKPDEPAFTDLEFPSDCIKIEGIDDLLTKGELAIHFPTAEKIFIRRSLPGDIVRINQTKITKNGGGALVKFPSAAEAAQVFANSRLRKMGPRRLEWLFPDEIRMENVTGNDMEKLKKHFPHAKSIIVNKQKTQAIITFRTSAEARTTAKSKVQDFMHLGDNVFGWPVLQDAYLSHIPWEVRNEELVEALPRAVAIQWLHTPEDGRTALIKFEDAHQKEESFIKSRFQQQKAFEWEWTEDKGQIWEPGTPIPDNGILVSDLDLDADVSESDIKNIFPTAFKVLKKQGPNSEMMSLVMFHSPAAAESAYHSSRLNKLGNKNVDWLFPDEVKIHNYPHHLGQSPLHMEFNSLQMVKLKKHREQAICVFHSAEEANNALRITSLIQLGNSGICWKNPHETYVLGAPRTVRDSDIKKEFPYAKKIKSLKTADGGRVIIIVHSNGPDQNKAVQQSNLLKSRTDDQILFWPKKSSQ